MDSKSQLAICASDIASYFDTFPPGKLARHLAKRIGDPWIAAAAVRLHLRPRMELCIFGCYHSLPRRKCGLITGSSSAAALQRLPLEDIIGQQLDFLVERCVSFPSFASGQTTKFATAYWSDNIFTFGCSVAAAMDMQQRIQVELERQWPPLRIGDDSKEILILAGNEETATEARRRGFATPSTLRVLGPQISSDASSEPNMCALKEKVLQAFFANIGDSPNAIMSNAKATDKVRLFETSSRGVVASLATAICFNDSVSKRLDKLAEPAPSL